jgi:hypothetical protein
MWSSSSTSRRKKAGLPASPPNNVGRRNVQSGWNEDRANEMFDELVVEEMPDAADMEGEILVLLNV